MGAVHDSKPDKPPHLPRQWWEHGIYENEYVKRDGVWLIRKLAYSLFTETPYEMGWAAATPVPSQIHTDTTSRPKQTTRRKKKNRKHNHTKKNPPTPPPSGGQKKTNPWPRFI